MLNVSPLRKLVFFLVPLIGLGVGCGPAELAGDATSGDTDASSDGTDTVAPSQGFIAHYFSPGGQTFMHYDDGAGWTSPPGMAMSPEDAAWVIFEDPDGAGSVQFVFTDGADAWDNNGEQNYVSSLPEFWVKDGVVYDERPDGGTDTGETPYCDGIDCSNGVCDEAAGRCDCNAGYLWDAGALSCIEDLCYGIDCAFGELCDPDNGSCLEACVPDRMAGEFTFCEQTTASSVGVIARYEGAGQLDLTSSAVRLNDEVVDSASIEFDEACQTIAVTAGSLDPSKYSYLFRMRTAAGVDLQPLFVPMWIGAGIRYSDFD